MTERQNYGLLLVIVACCLIAVPLDAMAQPKRSRSVRISVDSVLAANTGLGMDAQLASTAMGSRLKTLFEYTTYQLVMHQEQQTRCGHTVIFEMPGGRILHIVPTEISENMIAMELMMFEGTRPVMTTDLKLMNHAVLVVGGPRYHQGMLITMISTDADDDSEHHRPSRHHQLPASGDAPGTAVPAGAPPSP